MWEYVTPVQFQLKPELQTSANIEERARIFKPKLSNHHNNIIMRIPTITTLLSLVALFTFTQAKAVASNKTESLVTEKKKI